MFQFCLFYLTKNSLSSVGNDPFRLYRMDHIKPIWSVNRWLNVPHTNNRGVMFQRGRYNKGKESIRNTWYVWGADSGGLAFTKIEDVSECRWNLSGKEEIVAAGAASLNGDVERSQGLYFIAQSEDCSRKARYKKSPCYRQSKPTEGAEIWWISL